MTEVAISSATDVIKELLHLQKATTISITRCGMLNIPRIVLFLPQLTTLDLSSNPINSLDILWESNLPSLRELNLSACWLRSLPFGPPTFYSTLETLNLDGNFLGRFTPNFSMFKNLKKLSIVGNDFLTVPILPNHLETLCFRLNSFQVIPSSSISIFDASYCSLPFSITILSRQITFLDLSHCGISGDFIVPPMPLLDTFSASYNDITSLKFESSRRVTTIRLSYNGITEFPDFMFRLPMLRIAELSHNAISSIPNDLTGLKRVESLDLSHNQLITGRLILPQRIQAIRLSFNFSVTFESFPFSLKELDVSFCRVATIPPIPPSLQWLSCYFVSRLIVSDRIKAITNETNPETEKISSKPSKNNHNMKGNENSLNENCINYIQGDSDDSSTDSIVSTESINTMTNVSINRDNSLDGDFHNHAFSQERPIRFGEISVGPETLMNDKFSDYIGCSATAGRSTKYEDNFLYTKVNNINFIGVFDGHVGHQAAFLSAKSFVTLLERIVAPVFNDDSSQVIKNAIRRTFTLVNEELRHNAVKDGTTAVIAGINDDKLVVSHLGDSLALMICKDKEEWLTRPHRPTERNEYNRMRAGQKAVSSDWRIDGKLCVSRSLGDFWCCDGMYDEPDVVIRKVPDNIMSIVLGCDGLWDYVDSGVVCNVVRAIRDPVRASKLLQDYAFASGSTDNISVIVMNFPETHHTNYD
ncbi:hypothetical protein TRFO_41315 [Tritrichomonas foetus]|uniref:PPM-type phosphatase domain-containing protein n=1 Tax=Tritrichomonas foetus TaxID=1144522 RepID=A0A1J4L1X2_9EUKA|nr:hypothetical protein TRFO_41315 [Tritrichomonas foetus]|eukprot:OHT17072.1 hypothetical protein TRFO_41315 [Tritrichomonas foetus]